MGTLKTTFAMINPTVKMTNPKTQNGNNFPIINWCFSCSSFKIADSVKDAESQRVGKVLSIGDEITTVYGAKISCPPQIKIGSLVIHNQFNYNNVKYKNQAIKLVAFNDLTAIVNE